MYKTYTSCLILNSITVNCVLFSICLFHWLRMMPKIRRMVQTVEKQKILASSQLEPFDAWLLEKNAAFVCIEQCGVITHAEQSKTLGMYRCCLSLQITSDNFQLLCTAFMIMILFAVATHCFRSERSGFILVPRNHSNNYFW